MNCVAGAAIRRGEKVRYVQLSVSFFGRFEFALLWVRCSSIESFPNTMLSVARLVRRAASVVRNPVRVASALTARLPLFNSLPARYISSSTPASSGARTPLFFTFTMLRLIFLLLGHQSHIRFILVQFIFTESAQAVNAAATPAEATAITDFYVDITAPVVAFNGQPTGATVVLDGEVFAQPLRTDILQRCVEYHRAKRRKGMFKIKDRSEVSGSGHKMWKQKGTGRARVGDKRPPHWRHGGKAHGPVLRSFAIGMQKRVRQLGVKVALSARLAEKRLIVVDAESLTSHKTKEMQANLTAMGVTGRFIIVGALTVPETIKRGARNIVGAQVMNSISVTAYDLIRAEHVILTTDAVSALTERLVQVRVSPTDARTQESIELYEARLALHEKRLSELAKLPEHATRYNVKPTDVLASVAPSMSASAAAPAL
jgi:large subunit ribosomal protein L4